MRIVKLDAKNWNTVFDLYDALHALLALPRGYARNINALLDAMIWNFPFDGVPKNERALRPPYKIEIINGNHMPQEVTDECELIRGCLAEARQYLKTHEGYEVDTFLEVAG